MNLATLCRILTHVGARSYDKHGFHCDACKAGAK